MTRTPLATHGGGVCAYCRGLPGRGYQRTIDTRVGVSSHCVCTKCLFQSIIRTHHSFRTSKNGITRRNVLYNVRDSYESMRLCVATQDIIDCGWILFSCVSSAGMPSVLDCRRNFLGPVRFEGTEHEAVLHQIKIFIVRVARRLIVDMGRLDNMEELTTMWYKKEAE